MRDVDINILNNNKYINIINILTFSVSHEECVYYIHVRFWCSKFVMKAIP